MTIRDLIDDEIEAIEGYAKYLETHKENEETIKQIINDEVRHISMLISIREN